MTMEDDQKYDARADQGRDEVYVDEHCRDCGQQLLDWEAEDFGNRCQGCAHAEADLNCAF